MKGKLVSLLISVSMIAALMTGCGTTSEEVTTGPAATTGSTTAGNTATEASAASEAPGEDADSGEITEINYWTWEAGDGTAGSNALGKDVEAAINAITEEKIGVHVNFHWINGADYATQLSLAILNGEQVDVADYYYSGAGTFSSLYSSGSIMDITEVAAKYAPDALKTIEDTVLSGVTIDEKLYGIPTYRVLNANYYIIMRGDILDELGLREQAKNMKTWADYEAVMAAVKDSGFSGYATGGGAGFGMISNTGCIYQGENISDSVIFDPVGDAYFSVATDQEGHVYNQVAMEESKNQFQMFKRWMDAGYMYPDSAYDSTGAKELFNQGVLFSVFASSEYGVETSWKASSGYDCECYLVGESPLNTSNVQKFGLVVPTTCKEPEAVMKWINLLYTDPEIMNLITWGIEGKSYEVVDGVAQYIGEADALTSGFHNNDYKIGNSFLCLPWSGAPADFRDAARTFFKSAPASIYLGLTIDTSEHASLVSQISAVTDEFHGQMCGGFYTDDLYQEYLDKLNAAGIDDYVALYQDAIDEFLK